jgi:hypothetical protein
MDTVTGMIQKHPYISLVVSLMLGYAIIAYTQPAAPAAPSTPANEKKSSSSSSSDSTSSSTTTSNSQESFYQLNTARNSQFPEFNPAIFQSLHERTGIMNPVMASNKTLDVRGEPKGVREQVVPVETSFLKNPRVTEAKIDEIEVKNLRKERSVEY